MGLVENHKFSVKEDNDVYSCVFPKQIIFVK